MRGTRLLHGGGFAGPVVSEERGDLSLVELQIKVVDSKFPPFLVDFHQVSDVHTKVQTRGLWFNVV